jgi:hypothetical protein
MTDTYATRDLSISRTTSSDARSSIIHHTLAIGGEEFVFDEDSKVGIYIVGGTQIPRLDDAMIRALIRLQDQIAKGSSLDREPMLAALEHEIDRRIAMRRREK